MRNLLFIAIITIGIALSMNGTTEANDRNNPQSHKECSLPLKVVVYTQCQGHDCDGSTIGVGAPYSSRFGEFKASDINFGSNTSFNWHPFNQRAFGVEISSLIKVEKTASYAFTLTSDDRSQLWIDGSLIVDSQHIVMPTSNITQLTEGLHSLTVQFFECCSGPSGVDLQLPRGVAYVEDCKKTRF